MQKTAQKEWDILIIPCGGESYLGRLVVRAAEELALTYKVRILQEKENDDPRTTKEAIRSSDRCIIVDGCDKQCMLDKMKEYRCKTEFELNLSEMGIADRQQKDLLPEDLELAKDAIVAASSRVSLKPPVFPGCCC